jgi:DNA integrity scanning protein DisA with diadenylate cyclase activity
MTFGIIKSVIEKNLLESYKDEKTFKKTLREFKQNILNDKNLSRLYSIYDQLSTPQGLSDNDAKDFLDEGIDLVRKISQSAKFPKLISENIVNNYEDIDLLVNINKTNLSERLESKRNVLSILTTKKSQVKESISIPIKTMVNVANQTLKSYVETLDESSKKELFSIISEDSKVLENKFEEMKTSAITKLQSLMESENENDLKEKISETIDKLKSEKFDQINFLKLKSFSSSI